MWENRDIRYNVLRAVGYYKGKAVVEDILVLNGLEQAPHFGILYQDTKPLLKGEDGYNYLYRINCGEMILQIVLVSYGCRIIPITPVHGQQASTS